MRVGFGLAAGAALFVIVATANSGGYRYGISDQAYYVPAVALAADASLFPRDAGVFATQSRYWFGDTVLASVLGVLSIGQPPLFTFLYVAGLIALFGAVVFFLRGLGGSWWAVAGAAALFTLRHRIAKTGANSLEGYMHPRMIAFALGLAALGCLLRRRTASAILLVGAAWVFHPTTALWFAAATLFALLADRDRPRLRVTTLTRIPIVITLVAGALALTIVLQSHPMDAVVLSVLSEKDYLFAHEWPAYAWALNLLYPVVVAALYFRRRQLARATTREGALVAGLLALVAGFLVSVPLAATHNAIVVQLQANRVFWVLDAVALIYLAWWLFDDAGPRFKNVVRYRQAVAAVLIVLASARGVYILQSTGRSFAQTDLAADDWTDAMRWLRAQPAGWHVLADPGHAWKYGTSVRVAALRDTVLEQSKDSAMAMYDTRLAYRVSERSRALANFSSLSEEQFRELGQRFDVQVLVLEQDRALTLPRLYENQRFTIYALR